MTSWITQFHNPLKSVALPEKRNHPAFWLAVWFGAGLTPFRGPMGALVTLPMAYGLLYYGGQTALFIAAMVTLVVGIWAADWFNKATASKDASPIVIDEAAGMMLGCLFLPTEGHLFWLWWVWAYMLFNWLDYTKPWPADRLEKMGGGYGVMLDDIAAGVYTMLLVPVVMQLGN
jgi:phosphatidylglycerophosphatase A